MCGQPSHSAHGIGHAGQGYFYHRGFIVPCVPVAPWVQAGSGHSVPGHTRGSGGRAMDTTGPLLSKVSNAHKFGLGTGQGPQWDQMGIEKVQGQVTRWMTRARLTLESRSEYRGRSIQAKVREAYFICKGPGVWISHAVALHFPQTTSTPHTQGPVSPSQHGGIQNPLQIHFRAPPPSWVEAQCS